MNKVRRTQSANENQNSTAAKPEKAWRTFDERDQSEQHLQRIAEEFPGLLDQSVDRRNALRYLGAYLALAGLTGCDTSRAREILPYVRQPEEWIPGKPLFFATAFHMGAASIGVLCESHEGRPVKIEGNPDHPASLGAADIFAQAEVLNLWDPERSRTVTKENEITDWGAFDAFVRQAREGWLKNGGKGLRLLTGTVLSPTLADQINALIAELPEARWIQYEPLNRDSVYDGTRLAFGRPLNPIYLFDQADVVVSLEADFMRFGPGAVAYAKQFSRRRAPGAEMNRLYVAEAMPTVTGLTADDRLPVRTSEIAVLARALASKIESNVNPDLPERQRRWVDAAADDLAASGGRCIITAGEQQPAEVHSLVHRLNARLGAIGKAVIYSKPLEAQPSGQLRDFTRLVDEMRSGKVGTLVILDTNPVYASPVDLHFAEVLEEVGTRIHLGLFDDETAQRCHWHLPGTHFLEQWSDTRAYDGSASIIQPLIEPLYRGRSAHQVVAALSGDFTADGRKLVNDFWKKNRSGDNFSDWWRRGLYRGVLEDTAFNIEIAELSDDVSPVPEADKKSNGIEISIGPDPTIYDGRQAKNGWLQELPKPVVSLTWDNAAYMSEATANRLGVWSNTLVQIRLGDRQVTAPVWVTPGHADDAVTMHLGYGRESSGDIRGFNAYHLLASDGLWVYDEADIKKLDATHLLADRQTHQQMENRDLAVSAPLSDFREDPGFVKAIHPRPAPEDNLLPDWRYDGYKWGMAIDLNSCIGCGACTLACQSENNIPIVGKEAVIANRAMHWIRVDYYFQGDSADPEIIPQPVPCMQCEHAPCEIVCPVGATVHGEEGLNQMVYNRCVGTRYCSNNCPYKVRRFNFLDFSGFQPETYNGRMNPDVTVRGRGVMEKCTYCVQRIETARIESEKEGRKIRDGEIVTACQQTCPTEAIIFGDLNDRDSRVSKAKASPRDYGLLQHLNTRPRTTYEVRLKNRNQALQNKES